MSGTALAVAGSLAIWFLANLLAVSRRPSSAVGFYIASGLVEGGLGVTWGVMHHQAAWVVIGSVWIVAKAVVVPLILRADWAVSRYGQRSAGTPRLVLGSAVVLGLLWWVMGPAGVPLAAVLTAFWLLAGRREVSVEIVLLLEAEVATGFWILLLGRAPGLADGLAVVETVATAVLLAVLAAEARGRWRDAVTTDDLQELKG